MAGDTALVEGIKIAGVLKRVRRRDVAGKAERIQTVLRAQALRQPAVLARAYVVTVRSTVAVTTVLNRELTTLQGQVEAHFGRHPDSEIDDSQPGLGQILGNRVLGDDPHRYHDARARELRRTSPITRASGKKDGHDSSRQRECRPRLVQRRDLWLIQHPQGAR